MLGKLAYNVSGIAEGGEFMAESLNSAPRQAKTNFYELNLRKKTNKIRFWRNSRTDVEFFTLAPLLAIPCYAVVLSFFVWVY